MDTLLNVLLILFGAFFMGLLIFAFYIVLFPKHPENGDKKKESAPALKEGEVRAKMAGKT